MTTRQPLVDTHGRTARDLRISVTDRCNLRCVYCMPAEGMPWLPKDDLLTYEELARFARGCVECGVNGVRLTGGEPTVRPSAGGDKHSQTVGRDRRCRTARAHLS